MDDDQAAGFGDGGEDGRFVERLEAAQVDDLGGDPLAGQGVRCLQAVLDGLAVGHQRHVAPGAQHGGLAEGDGGLAGRHLLGLVEQADVEEKQHRVVVADRRLEQPLGISRGTRHHHLEAGAMDEPGLVVVVVLGADTPAGASHRQRHEREGELPAGHVAQLAGAVDQLVHGIAEERGEEQVDDRAQAGAGGAGRGAGDDALGKRRVAHAAGAELLHQIMALGRDALAENENAVVAAHFLDEGGADGIV